MKKPRDEYNAFFKTAERHCPMCDKEFYIYYLPDWAYKRTKYTKTFYFCSYKCAREYDNQGANNI